MKKYLAIIKIAYISVLENRWQVLIANLQSAFTLFILFFFWQSIFSNRQVVNGYTFSQIITYYFIIRVTYNRVSTFGASTLAKDIRSGNICRFLVRPYNFTLYQTCQYFTRATLWTLGNLFAIIIFAPYFFRHFIFPPNIVSWFVFGLTFILNGFLSIAINLNIGYIAFWIGEVTHLKIVSTILITILSGGLIPLTFFPDWFQKLSNFLPFRYLVQFPTDVYFGRLGFDSIWAGIFILLAWVIALYFLAALILRHSLQSYESYN